MQDQRSTESNPFHFTPALVLTVFMLLICGFIVLASAGMGSTEGEGGPLGFIEKQAMFCGLGVVLSVMAYYFPHRWMQSYTFFFILYGFVVGALLSVYFIGSNINDVKNVYRWISIPGLGISFQPSEITKLGIVLMVAIWACLNPQKIQKLACLGGVVPLGLMISVILALIFIEPDYATTMVCGSVAMATFYVAGVSARWVTIAMVLLVLLVGYTVNYLELERSGRIYAWQNLYTEMPDENRQQLASIKAIVTGQLLGKGIGMGTAKLGGLSEHDSDFIFAVVAEELGFIGVFCVLLGFVFILYAGTSISIKSKDIFGRVLAMGIVTAISIQVLLNVATTSALVPNTGLTFPFFSKGGSNLIMMLISMGFLMGVERETRRSSAQALLQDRNKKSAISNPFEQ